MSAPGEGELHLWFCRRELVAGSEPFQREVLSRYAGVAPIDLNFARGPHGKPALSSPHLPIAFNLSNCRDQLVIAISSGAAVGVDLEYCDPRRDVEKLAQRFFSATEVLQMSACAGAPKVDRFYDYWTLKEAAIKATGGSLGRELESTSFGLTESVGLAEECTPGSITALTSPVEGTAWFGLLQPFEEYRLAICCIAADDFSAGILQFDWPHDTPQMCPPRLLATSSVDSKTARSASL